MRLFIWENPDEIAGIFQKTMAEFLIFVRWRRAGENKKFACFDWTNRKEVVILIQDINTAVGKE